MKKLATILTALLVGAFLTACMSQEMKPMDSATLSTQGYKAKVDNFLVIFDASSSMFMDHNKEMKFKQAKRIANSMNATIPADLGLNGGIRLFGPEPYALNQADDLLYGMAAYKGDDFAKALASVRTTGGGTPLATAVRMAASDLAKSEGKTALIVISDAEDVGNAPVVETQALKAKMGDNLCVYTILIGNSKGSKQVMEDMATAGNCGFATDYAALNSSAGMADFVQKVFLEKVKEVVPMKVDGDEDMDGVKDSVDRCPGTPRGVKVDQYGCPLPMKDKTAVQLRVEFDTDKYFIKPEYKETLKDFADFMSAYPETTVTIEGHTDSTASDAYNQKLSEKRAKSVVEYLTTYFNVDAKKLTAKGFGESRPEASNDTAEGRQKNRRVMAVFSVK